MSAPALSDSKLRRALACALAGLLGAAPAAAAEPAALPLSPPAQAPAAQPAAAPLSPSASPAAAAAAQPPRAAPNLAAGKAAFAAGDYAGAEGLLELASAETGAEAEVWNYLGNVRWKLGKREAALDAYERCLELNPEQPELRAFVRQQRPAKPRPRREELEFSPAAQSLPPARRPGFLERQPWIPPLWRSALLPGWGQVYKGERRKGIILGILTLGSGVVGLVTRNSAAQAQAEYQALPPGLPESSYEGPDRRRQTWSLISQSCFVGFGVLYGLNLLDAAWASEPPSLDSGALRLAPLGDGLQASLELARF